MFFLPLPFNNTVETVDEVIVSKVLPEPELYIIINGSPTKNNVLWQDLVDVEDLKAAIASSKMPGKATKQDIYSFQAFTTRDL